jgi:hypothetical protein
MQQVSRLFGQKPGRLRQIMPADYTWSLSHVGQTTNGGAVCPLDLEHSGVGNLVMLRVGMLVMWFHRRVIISNVF